jgi:hypothetical protein
MKMYETVAVFSNNIINHIVGMFTIKTPHIDIINIANPTNVSASPRFNTTVLITIDNFFVLISMNKAMQCSTIKAELNAIPVTNIRSEPYSLYRLDIFVDILVCKTIVSVIFERIYVYIEMKRVVVTGVTFL